MCELVSENVSSVISRIMNCNQSEIRNLSAMKRGMTNRSYSFILKDRHYLARIPGEGTDRLIDRRNEYAVYQKISSLEICDDLVYIDPETGYKITVYWKNVRVCNPHDLRDVKACMFKLRSFHGAELEVPHFFDIFERIEFYESLWNQPSCYEDYAKTKADVMFLHKYIASLSPKLALTHIDAVPDNFLIFEDNEIRLIDWEYASMQDPHVDIAMFAVYAMYNRDQVESLIDAYFTEGCPIDIRAKIYAYIAICGLLWSNWCEYKRQYNIEFGVYALKQYEFAKSYSTIHQEAQLQYGYV